MFSWPLPPRFHLKDLSKNNLIRKVVSEHSQKTKNEKILFSHPEILCTIKIICAQGVREVLLPYKTHTVVLLGLQKFLYKWMFRAGDWQEEIIPEKKFFCFCFGMLHYGGMPRLSSPHFLLTIPKIQVS